jgi:predicted nuclease of predicted toxin-antitoxin system
MLLIDENLSFRLVEKTAHVFPGSIHVENALHRGASDNLVESYAITHNLIVVTKDRDYVPGFSSPFRCRVVYIDLPNCKTDDVARILIDHADLILELRASSAYLPLILPPKTSL